MCDFISLILDRNLSEEITTLMKRYNRIAIPYENDSLTPFKSSNETAFTVVKAHCDCGTVLRPREIAPAIKPAELAKRRKQGWSESKIERWIDDKLTAHDRKPEPCIDSLELWDDILREILSFPKVQRTGLFLHFYNRSVHNEKIDASLRHQSAKESSLDVLNSFQPDEVTFITHGDTV